MTIKQLADYVGVTTRAVRHYHRIGLLAEPERSASGYRLYGAQDVVDLQRIKVLADAGVPLARVRELVDAGPDALAAAVREIDVTLRARIRELQATRKRLAALASGDDPFVTPRLAQLLARVEELGVSERSRHMNRDGWILVQAVYPSIIDPWLDWQEKALDDPEYRELYVLTDRAQDWAADDPRIEGLARRTVAWIRTIADPQVTEWEGDAVAYGLVTGYEADNSPGWDALTKRIQELLAEAGYQHAW